MPRINLETIAIQMCSWCGRLVPAGEEYIPLAAPFEFEEHERVLIGKAVEFSMRGFIVTGFLFPDGSAEKAEGFDLGLVACSDDCADKALEYASNQDVRLKPLTEATVRLKTSRT